MSEIAPGPSIIDLNPACAVERLVLFGSGVTLLFAFYNISYAIYSQVIGHADEALGFLLLALAFMSVYGFLRLFSQFVKKPLLFDVVLVLVFLFYAIMTGVVTVMNWSNPRSWPTLGWLVSLTLLLLTIRALRQIGQGALGVFSTVKKYKRTWARNGSFRRFVLFRGLLRPKGMLYFGGALACLLSIPFAQESFKDYPFWTLLFIPAAWWLYRAGGRLSIAKVINSEAELPPSFTLYLRSFLDDAVNVTVESHSGAALILRALFGGDQLDAILGYSSSLEETCVAALWPFDPVLCLGKSSSQPLGALRMEVSDTDWRSSVIRLCEAATRIVLIISPTSGLAWEYRELLTRKLHSKLILVLPPELPHQTAGRWGGKSLAAEQLLTRWSDSISGTVLAETSPRQLEASVAVRFQQDGSPIFLHSDARTAVAYSVALASACLPVAKLELLCHREKGELQ